MGFRIIKKPHFKNVIASFFIAYAFIACSTKFDVPKQPQLKRNEFKAAFFQDCHQIRTIFEGHQGSGYYLNNYQDGKFTSAITLETMTKWLNDCGADSSAVNQILE